MSVFLCYASEDRPTVKELSRHLSNAGFAPWLDVEKILPGADWRKSIVAAVETCDAIVLCLSSRAVAKTGYIQTEIRVAMEVADLQPLDAVYIYPVRLDECNILDQFKHVQHADYFASSGLEKLVLALKERARYLKLPLDQSN